jgi:UDP-N-acetylmuramyl pentapeptide phosphotransferase/UDP-N-acetylglucosamine-1-phosphate transferase
MIVFMTAVVSAGLIVLLRPWLKRYALARPNARSSHVEPTAQGGGIAVLAATVCGVAIAAVAVPLGSGTMALLPVFGAAIALAVVGAIDDMRMLGAAPRLLVQAIAIIVVIATLPGEIRAAPFLPLWVERALLVLGGIWFVNLVNFMDGIDWMTVAEMVPLTAGLALIGMLGALPPEGIVVALALSGAILGFAPFNRPVAQLFLGDVGSLPIGLLTGWLLVLVASAGHVAAAFLLPLYYLADATITLGRRLHAGERVWQAHRTHFYQRAGDAGFSNIEIVARVFAVNLALLVLAAVTVVLPSWQGDLAAFALGAAMVAWLIVSFARGKS